MYNKIAQIILNSSKGHGTNVVYISQPDSIKEQQGGKIFIIASLDSKKHRNEEILDFIVSNIENYYYNDEKLELREKIEGLKIENIFEAALSKTNKSLIDFLEEKRDYLNLGNTHITLGVIYENKLHFSNFGNNKAYLIFAKSNGYELINIESDVNDIEDDKKGHSKLFSSIISGEIPENSYFLVVNETIPEYISNEELIEIITKLPPVVAAEQIKNILNKINSYVPFLGIIIQNTVRSIDEKEEQKVNSAQASISTLNYTEEKTEEMLSPAGLIDLRKMAKKSKRFIVNIKKGKTKKKNHIHEIKKEKEEKKSNKIKNIKKLNIPRPDSFLIKDKIIFKKRSGRLLKNIKEYFSIIPYIFRILFSGLRGLSKKRKLLVLLLVIIIIIFSFSLFFTKSKHNSKVVNDKFDNLVTQIEDKEALIDSHLLYDDNDGARIVLQDTKELLKSFPLDNDKQEQKYEELMDKLSSQEDKIEKITSIDTLEIVANINNIYIKNIVWTDKGLYVSNNDSLYKIIERKLDKGIKIQASKLSHPYYYKDSLYYLDRNKIVKYNIKDNKEENIEVEGLNLNDAKSFKIYVNKLYVLNSQENQIQKYSLKNNKYSSSINWIKDKVNLSSSTDIAIDGSIYVLNKDGNINYFYGGKKKEYKENIILPKLERANKLLVGDKYLYILDPLTDRIVILVKEDGSIKKQYKFNNITIRDFTVDDKAGIIYILSPDKVYKIEIK